VQVGGRQMLEGGYSHCAGESGVWGYGAEGWGTARSGCRTLGGASGAQVGGRQTLEGRRCE
jgi:hypothetical protein